MVNVAFSSDNHFDINKVPLTETIQQQADYLRRHQIQYYLIAGDLFNSFTKSADYVRLLQAQLPDTKVFFIAGNHDMLNGVTYEELETGTWPGYLNNRFVDILGTNYRIIGLNGWYDYSFAAKTGRSDQQIHQWKMAYWVDSLIKQPMSDPQREQIVIDQLTTQLQAAQRSGKQTILVTHFVPNGYFIHTTDDNRFWNMANAMLGSQRITKVIDQYATAAVVFGHIHNRIAPVKIANTWYYNAAVGYNNNHHHNEWRTTDFLSEWRNQLKTIQLF